MEHKDFKTYEWKETIEARQMVAHDLQDPNIQIGKADRHELKYSLIDGYMVCRYPDNPTDLHVVNPATFKLQYRLQLQPTQFHCPTCQCERIKHKPVVPGNPMSRSWHK